ncbi:MAG: maleylpyruvate isomerase family mycothiol-dependent enzyme [Actinoplanes sp.]
MEKTLDFADLLRLIDERSVAFRAAVAAAPLDQPVPTCPEWTLLDLAQHLGRGNRKWAGIVAGGSPDVPPADAPSERADLLAWSAESTEQLLAALRAAGPDRGCWTWWDRSESPQTAGAVARHRVQEAAVHTYDAQLTGGAAQPLPTEVALDGVDEFLHTCCAGAYSWPYQPCVVEYRATEGPSWFVSLAADRVRVTRLPIPADASFEGTAGELVLAMYGRIPATSLKVGGDAGIFDLLMAWDPDA